MDAIDRVDHITVKLLRARKKGVSAFMLVNEDWHMVSIGQKWTQGNAVGYVSDMVDGNVQLRIVKGSIKTGDIQTATTCHLPEQALRLATDFWAGYWKKGSRPQISDEHATRVVQALPEMPPIQAAISQSELKNALKILPLGKARGMDAVSNWELKYMCEDLQHMLLQLLNRICETGQWPQPLTNARMHLIRKNAEPGDINSTRPICILPNVYRLWGKIMTSKCFKHIRMRLPSSLCGSVPGRSSIDLAMQLQSEIEHHIITGVPLYGASLDLHKAFNTLSRPLLAKMCHRLGLQSIWMPYEKFLSSLNRYFTLKQHWSHPISSDNGVPEGCPLSVVMMVLITWGITEVMKQDFPSRTMCSYVDDWTLRDTSPKRLVDQLLHMKALTDGVGLSLSMRKTVTYATTAPSRKSLSQALKLQGLPSEVSDTGNSLGMQFQARAAKVTDLREKRVLDSTPKLKRLKIMPWSCTKKATMLLTGVFPSLLYGCEFHDMGLHFISHIRSQCNNAVWRDKPYLSHFLTPILSTRPVYEPWLWILKRVYHSFRRLICLQPTKTRELWNIAIPRPSSKHTVGPVTILMSHLRRLGWTLAEDFQCQTPEGQSFSLERITLWQYKNLITTSWQAWLVPKLKTKLSLSDLERFDIGASCWHDPDPQNEGFMATLRSGGLFTNKVKSRISAAVSPFCSMCGEADGMTHRIYDCPAAEEIRKKLHCHSLKHEPRSKLVYGLFQQPPALEDFYRGLDEIRISNLLTIPDTAEPTHLFTDGSCTQPSPSRKMERRASYAVRTAVAQSHSGSLVATGTLPGRKQTAFRAELFAMMVAMSTCMNSIIYTDCRAVWLGIARLQRDGWDPLHWVTVPDADLWWGAWQILNQPERRLSVEWTKSHRSISEAANSFEAWSIYHNNLTDKAASTDNYQLHPQLQEIWENLVQQNAHLEAQRKLITTYLREIWELHAAADKASGSGPVAAMPDAQQ